MSTIKNIEKIKESTLKKINLQDDELKFRVVVGMATCGVAAGADKVMDALDKELANKKISNVDLVKSGCIGLCKLEPIVMVYPGSIMYVRVSPEDVPEIIEQHILKGQPVERLMHPEQRDSGNKEGLNSINFFKKQTRIALRNCGIIDPEDIDEYIAFDGYKALEKALKMSSEEIIETMKKAGLRGRGGAGFPTWMKWNLATKYENDQKYVLCNADEGDPGAFMDRSVLEGDPHSVLEAMAIAGRAIGSNQGYIYVRAEYPMAIKRLENAITKAREYGLLGKNIFDTGFDFDIELRLGAGAFVCGEETALMTSIEGKRGEPRPRPPYPAYKGLWQKPTILNNVETYANIPAIFNRGADWFASMGTEKSKGTKVFAVGGKINTTGLVEVPIGTTLREVVFGICGGIPNGKQFKAAQTGGPSGGCIPLTHLDLPIDYETLLDVGAMMGSGALIVMDEDNCMVDIAKFFLDFTVDESCGKCPPCRVGTKRMYEILERITEDKGTEEDLEILETLAKNITIAAACGLGQTAPKPVLSTLRHFKNEYIEHVKDHKCSSKVCKAMLQYVIDSSKCKLCGLCAKSCPANCISGDRQTAYKIDSSKCIKCGACMANCKFKAINRE